MSEKDICVYTHSKNGAMFKSDYRYRLTTFIVEGLKPIILTF